ncbi:Flp pilus assembly protein CpaB [Zobellella iuensis]|uniref:Flp pilus assembly protein CpaB n=1 Tax=Zobellella iuensis TaxID=2803811 RepID=A0ABS1QQ70_9GAMM|nr:Flp pilus assembly protein CpaB [Zobellella iuensis]MBL1376606.1 Flp pilus assembly protein CpaB [Zobellella iuensis]
MNSRLTLGLAGVLLAGALVAGYQGIKLSRQMSASEPPVAGPAAPLPAAEPAMPLQQQLVQRVDEEQRSPVVVLARPLQPFEVITAEHLAVEQLKIVPPDTFSGPDAVIGRHAWQALPAGIMLNQSLFKAGGPLARLIGEQERALAIAVDEVVGGGGFISPGDYVDVLLYLKETDKNTDQSAQVVVPALRVLSFGEALAVTASGEPALYPQGDDHNSGRRSQRQASTAVLAVPAPLLTRFMLASQVGTLRLAVRSADEQRLAGYYRDGLKDTEIKEMERQLFQFEKLALRQARPPAQPSAQPGVVSRAPSVTIYRGPDVSRQTP